MILAVITLGDSLGLWIASIYPFEFGAAWFAKASEWIGYLLMSITGFFLFRNIIMILLAPVLSPLSLKVENYLLQPLHPSTWSFKQLTAEIARSIRINVRIIFRELFFTLLLIIIGFIPVIGWGAAAIIFMVQSYYAGFQNMDFTLERHFNVKESVRFVRANRGLAIGNGMVFIMILMVPGFGLLFGPPLAVIAATIGTVGQLPKDMA